MAVNQATKNEQQILNKIFSPEITDDPLAFVLTVFPWGVKGSPLEFFPGPRKWQAQVLLEIKEHIAENKRRILRNEDPVVYKLAIASGRGIGKSSLVAWLSLWMMSCHVGSSTIVTANTEGQLKDKTWGEMGKWHRLAINAHWFEKTSLALKPSPWFKDIIEKQLNIDSTYYYAQGQLWSEDNPDAFAGAHNYNGLLLIYDEASGIHQKIYSVSEGFFTEKTIYRFWICFSNPRRNSGPFFEAFHRMRRFWNKLNIDSRTVEGTDLNVYNQIIEQYGEDSDEARIEVKGEFPRRGDKQFISTEVIENARIRPLENDAYAALMMGVDPARFGDDSTVIRFRQGRNGRVIPPIKLKGADNMEVANKCAELIDKYNPDAVCIDAGNGTGIIDRLREMQYKVNEVWFGSKSEQPEWVNKRTEIWAAMREWLSGGCIDGDQELIDDLCGPEYHFQGAGDKIMLESKDKMKSRGLSSPDNGDAFALTFAVRVARRDTTASRSKSKSRVAKGTDYNIFGG